MLWEVRVTGIEHVTLKVALLIKHGFKWLSVMVFKVLRWISRRTMGLIFMNHRETQIMQGSIPKNTQKLKEKIMQKLKTDLKVEKI